MNKENISKSVIRRLPRYYRFLSDLEEQGIEKISSKQLAKRMRLTASQIRQDLNCFGGFGHQGYGYSVTNLKEEIINILGLNNHYKAVLIGAGHIGTAIAAHMKFDKMGFDLIGIFDNNQRIVGSYINDLMIRSESTIEEFCAENSIEAAFLCIPRSAAPQLVKKLYESGIRCFWNFTHYVIQDDYPDAVVENVHLSDMLMTLCYSINKSEEGNGNEVKRENE